MIKSEQSQTYFEGVVRLVGGGVDGKDHTSLAVTRREHQSPYPGRRIERSCAYPPAPCLQ